MTSAKPNSLNQALDISGSITRADNYALSDEASGLGNTIVGQSGGVASVVAFSSPSLTIGGLAGMGPLSVGRFLTMSGANNVGNNGAFIIDTVLSPFFLQ